MSWLLTNRRALRLAVLVLLVAGLLGPWGYEVVSVPDEYACTPPYVRVRSNFCGEPFSGFWMISYIGLGFFAVLGAVISGQRSFQDAGRELLTFLAWLPALPMVAKGLLLWKPESRRFRWFQRIALLLAAAVTFFWAFLNPDTHFIRLWGPWLFLVGLLAGLILEWGPAIQLKAQSS